MVDDLDTATVRRLSKRAPSCRLISKTVRSVSDYLEVFDALYSSPDDLFWFRGHAQVEWELCPSALRYDTEVKRTRAISTLSEFRRLQEIRFSKPPAAHERFKWLQLAQHHGLPTRLLDWTQNLSVALYFACEKPDADGLVFAFNPRDLNRLSLPRKGIEIVDPDEHRPIIDSYLSLGGRERRNGKKTIAVKPTWNSERIILQQGTFTLHGETFALDNAQAPSLVGIPILKDHKAQILYQLDRIGVSEMFIFPEPEHVCNFLKSRIDR
jgi:hypothetical protein